MKYKQEDFKQPRILTPLLQGVIILQIIATSCVGVAATYTLITGQKPVLYSQIFDVYQLVRESLEFWPLICMIVAFFWIYRVNKNTHILSTQKLEFTPGWAVGWFFVPVASLVQPYLVVSELYNANRDPTNWKSLKRPWITGIWWTCNVVGSLYGLAVGAAVQDGVLSADATVPIFFIIVFHQLLALTIYSRIAKWQMAAHKAGGIGQIF